MRGVTNEASSKRAAEQNGIEIGLSQPSGRPAQRGVHGQTDVLGDPVNLDRVFSLTWPSASQAYHGHTSTQKFYSEAQLRCVFEFILCFFENTRQAHPKEGVITQADLGPYHYVTLFAAVAAFSRVLQIILDPT
jgi:hypothetical protein